MSLYESEYPTPYNFVVRILIEAAQKRVKTLTIRLEDPTAPHPYKHGFSGKSDEEVWREFAEELKRAEYRGENPEEIIQHVLIDGVKAKVRAYKDDLAEEWSLFSQRVIDRTRGVVVLHDGTPYRCFISRLFPHVSCTLERMAAVADRHGLLEEFRYHGKHKEWILVFGDNHEESLEQLLEK